jgi:hypothetical protein
MRGFLGSLKGETQRHRDDAAVMLRPHAIAYPEIEFGSALLDRGWGKARSGTPARTTRTSASRNRVLALVLTHLSLKARTGPVQVRGHASLENAFGVKPAYLVTAR